MLLAFAAVTFEFVAGIFELARFLGIEFGLGSADFTNKNVEVGRTFLVPDESGKREFLNRHRLPPCRKHSKYPALRPDYYGILMRLPKSASIGGCPVLTLLGRVARTGPFCFSASPDTPRKGNRRKNTAQHPSENLTRHALVRRRGFSLRRSPSSS